MEVLMLDSNSIVPLYEQAAEALRRDIRNGVYDAKYRLPTEEDLSAKYGISRITVRHALTELVREGLVERKQGKGTFICRPTMHKDLKRSGVSFTELCESNGKRAGAKLLAGGIETISNPRVAEWLGLNIGDEVLRIKRIRYADDVPCVIEDNYFPPSFRDLLSIDLDHDSIYQWLREKRGINIVTGEMILRIIRADGQTARLLKMTRGTPLLNTWGRIFQANGEMLHVCNQIGYGENFEFIVR